MPLTTKSGNEAAGVVTALRAGRSERHRLRSKGCRQTPTFPAPLSFRTFRSRAPARARKVRKLLRRTQMFRPTAAVERRKHIVCLIAEETSDCRLSRESPSAAEQFPHLSRAGWRPRAKGSE